MMHNEQTSSRRPVFVAAAIALALLLGGGFFALGWTSVPRGSGAPTAAEGGPSAGCSRYVGVWIDGDSVPSSDIICPEAAVASIGWAAHAAEPTIEDTASPTQQAGPPLPPPRPPEKVLADERRSAAVRNEARRPEPRRSAYRDLPPPRRSTFSPASPSVSQEKYGR